MGAGGVSFTSLQLPFFPEHPGAQATTIPSHLRHSVLCPFVAAMVMLIENTSGPMSLAAHFKQLKYSKVPTHLCARGVDDSLGVLAAFYALTMPSKPSPLEIPLNSPSWWLCVPVHLNCFSLKV